MYFTDAMSPMLRTMLKVTSRRRMAARSVAASAWPMKKSQVEAAGMSAK